MAISKIKLPDNSVQELRDSRMGNAKIFYGTCDTAAATVAKVVTCPDFTAEDLVKGALIFVTFDYTNSGAVANLTLNVNGTGAKNIKKLGGTSSAAVLQNLDKDEQIQTNQTYLFQYDGTYWVCISLDWNTNSTYALYNLPESGGYTYYIADSAIYRYQLLFQRDTNKLTPLNNNSNVTTATKTMLTNVTFDPFGKIYYYGTTTAVAANGNISGGLLLYHALVDFRYSVNQTKITAYKDVYLQVIPQSDGMVKIASATPLVQEFPTTNDGYWYIFLGRAYNTTNLSLYSDHPVYRHNGTEIVEVPNPKLAANFVSTSEYDSDQEVLANSINDLNDRIDAKVSNVQSDWNATSGLAEILNKPTIPTETTVSGWGFTKNNGTVTGSGLTNNTIVLGSGTTGIKTSSKTIVTTLGTNDTTIPTSKAVKDAIDALPEPMQFKGTVGTGGTITTLPAAATGNTGYTYKVITNGTYQSIAAKAGDTFISNGSSWTLIPSGDEPSGTVTNVATGTGLIGGPITTTGTISIDTDVVALKSDVPTAVTEATVSGWGFTKNTGTITGITMNGASKGTSGVVNLGTVITSETQPDWNVTNTSSAAYIKNKPTIPAAQVQSDWNATSGLAQILNKPTIPTESTVSGWGFTKNSGTVTSVKVGTTSYNPSSGVVSLPAYPTVPTIPTAMTATEANTGTATTARTITAAVLAGAIDNKITCMTQNEVDTTVNTIFS